MKYEKDLIKEREIRFIILKRIREGITKMGHEKI